MNDVNINQFTPSFIPRIFDNSLYNKFDNIPIAFFEAHHIEHLSGVYLNNIEKIKFLIIDPVTHILNYKEAREKPSFKKLPYSFDMDIQKLYSEFNYRNDNLIKPSIEYQISKQSNIIISPYLFAYHVDDLIFSTNLTMLKESIDYINNNNYKIPLFAVITLNCHTLEQPNTINYVLNRYLEFNKILDGFLIIINDLDCKKGNPSQIFGLAKMVNFLSQYNNVLLKQVGSIGDILIAIGAIGNMSGLDTGEKFSLKNLESSSGRIHPRIFIPELFNYINDQKAIEIKYKCKCSYCNNTLPKTSLDKKIHFYTSKIELNNKLKRLNQIQKIDFMINEIKNSEEFSNRILGYDTNYLKNWRNILELSKTWEFTKQDEINLIELLKDLDKGNND